MLTLIADEILPIGLTLIVYKLVSVLTSKADEIVPIGLVLLVHDIDSKVKLICNWIDTGLRNPYGVGIYYMKTWIYNYNTD